MALAGGKDDANKHLELGRQMLSSGNLLDALSHFDSAVSKYIHHIMEHLCMKATPDLHLTYCKNWGNQGLVKNNYQFLIISIKSYFVGIC